MHATTSPTRNLGIAALLTALLICCFAFSPKIHAVVPAPDGGYPGGNTAEGTSALFLLTNGIANTAIGFQALYRNTTGNYNTAEGFRTLVGNTTGSNNTGNGAFALTHNTTGINNTATGLQALLSNKTGNNNTADGVNSLNHNTTGTGNTASGLSSLVRNTTGDSNVGIGVNSLNHNTTGSGNIALGKDAGSNLTTGDDNIDIGSVGVAGESGIIRIGTPGMHTDTFLNGVVHAPSDVAIGIANPATRLHVVKFSGSNDDPAGHVTLLKDDGLITTILALQSGYSGTHNSADNFITFFNVNGASLGSIEGNNAGSVQLAGAGSDYAEYLPKANPAAQIAATQIVGVRGGRIVPSNAEADQYMVVTAQAIVAGNRPSEDEADLATRGLVSFIGQVPVQVRGPVTSGDYVIASQAKDGTGIAKPANKVRVEEMHRVVGRAWESSAKKGLKQINAAVGLDQTSLVVPALERLERENQELRAKLAELEAREEASEARLSRLENGTQMPVYRPLPPR